MSESEVKRLVHGRWRRATKEEREDDGDLYIPFVLRDVRIGGRRFTGLFGFSQPGRWLVRVGFHSGPRFIIPVTEGTVLFQQLAEQLERELGTPTRMVRNNSGHTAVYADYAVWRFPSSVIELVAVAPNEAERGIVLSYALPSEAALGSLQVNGYNLKLPYWRAPARHFFL